MVQSAFVTINEPFGGFKKKKVFKDLVDMAQRNCHLKSTDSGQNPLNLIRDEI